MAGGVSRLSQIAKGLAQSLAPQLRLQFMHLQIWHHTQSVYESLSRVSPSVEGVYPPEEDDDVQLVSVTAPPAAAAGSGVVTHPQGRARSRELQRVGRILIEALDAFNSRQQEIPGVAADATDGASVPPPPPADPRWVRKQRQKARHTAASLAEVGTARHICGHFPTTQIAVCVE